MNEQQKLLNRLSAAQFAAWELHLFLDTHPNDKAAIAAYNTYYKRYLELYHEYISKYGNLQSGVNDNAEHWEWTDDPWPWNVEKECEK